MRYVRTETGCQFLERFFFVAEERKARAGAVGFDVVTMIFRQLIAGIIKNQQISILSIGNRSQSHHGRGGHEREARHISSFLENEN